VLVAEEALLAARFEGEQCKERHREQQPLE
jgi:hypothetical protein